MPHDIRLSIDGLPGDEPDTWLPGSVAVFAWSWGAQAEPTAAAGDRPACTFDDLQVTKAIDGLSPRLLRALHAGQEFASARLVVRTVGERPLNLVTVLMHAVRVSSYAPGGSAGSDDPVESVGFSFGAIEMEHVSPPASGSGPKATGSGHLAVGHVESAKEHP